MNIHLYTSAIQNFIEKYHYGSNPKELYEPISYLMSLGGKRMRPLLTILGYQLFDNDWQKAIPAAVAVEVFHNFTLMHDDIMDKAPLRRNQPTVHHKWNENIAILSGDVMLVKAYEILLQGVEDKYLRKSLEKFGVCAAWVCEGQQLDMNFEKESHISENQYIEMIRLKTAVLLGFSLELGAMLAGASEEEQTYMRIFGENIGIGFQLKDDLLDVYGNPDKFGKQVGGDIIANKKTYLLIEALQLAENEQKTALNFWLTAQDFDPIQKVKAVTEIYNSLKIKEKTEEKIQYFFDTAFTQLQHLAATHDDAKEFLADFMRQLITRES
ncbi:MAG: polyprenyl synthetase family protein [Thermonemataceae bacterium]|nr:polyprenyl synthetase family protein [Thermonemataceae bacterium]